MSTDEDMSPGFGIIIENRKSILLDIYSTKKERNEMYKLCKQIISMDKEERDKLAISVPFTENIKDTTKFHKVIVKNKKLIQYEECRKGCGEMCTAKRVSERIDIIGLKFRNLK